jgi:hypothetical protein
VPPEVKLKATSPNGTSAIWVHTRRASQDTLYYLHNTSRTDGTSAELCIRGQGRLERWDLHTGESAELSQKTDGQHIYAHLAFAPLASHLIVVRGTKEPHRAALPTEHVVEERPAFERAHLTRCDPNALTLDYCQYCQGQGAWSSPLPVLTVYELLAQQGYTGPISLRYLFEVADRPARACIVVEDAAAYRIRVNGEPVEYSGREYWIDRSFHPIDVTSLIRQGTNEVRLDVDFSPLPQAQFSLARLFQRLVGTELEAIYVIGDFAVESTPSDAAPKPRCVRLSPRFQIVSERDEASGDLVSHGYPFYAGRVVLSDSVVLRAPRPGERIVLAVPGIDAAALAKVRVNDTDAGAIMWAPYECDITSLVRDGENCIEVELIGTLRNLLGPHHRPEGEPDQCWTQDYMLRPEWLADDEARDEHWTDDYFFVRFGIEPGAVIRYIAHLGPGGEG